MRLIIIILLFPFFLIAQSQPNIIFILADDLGNGEIGSTVSDWYTPNIDSLRAQGAYFSRFYVQPSCSPTRAAFMTGRYPFRYAMGERVITTYEANRGLPQNKETLPERLRTLGYYTGVIGKWHLGHGQPQYLPYNQGFDYEMSVYLGRTDYNEPYAEQNSAIDIHENGEWFDTTGYITEVFGAKAVQFINRQAQDPLTPFFLYVPFTAPHTPIQAPTDTVNLVSNPFAGDKAIKWAMNRIMDNEVGKIWQAVIDNGIEDNTIIIFTSDNGGELAHGAGRDPAKNINDDVPGDNTPYSGEKTQLFDGGIRVPFIWYHKNTVIAGIENDTLTGIIDMFPTIVKRAGGTTIAADSLDGFDIGPIIGYSGTWTPNRHYIGYLSDAPQWAVMRGPWKLCNNPEENTVSQGSYASDIRLYNLDTDTLEATDVQGSNASIVTELQGYIDAVEGQLVQEPDISASKPGGWWDFPIWGLPSVFHNALYYWYQY